MRWNWKREIFPLGVLVLVVAVSFYFYPILSDRIPVHFNVHNQPDRYGSRWEAISWGVGSTVVLYLILTFLPFIDPFWKKIRSRYSLLLLFRDIVLVFILFVYVLAMVSARAGVFQRSAFGVGYGLLFILLGNYLPRLPRNFFFGVRSPWTLSSEIVWKKTHMVSGWLFILAGLLIIVLPFLGLHLAIVLLGTIIPLVLFCAFIYPLVLYKRLQREKEAAVPEL
jgi:uncharacterized membrane protein